MSEVGSGVRGGGWCQCHRCDPGSEVGSGARDGIWCQNWGLVSEVGSSVRGGSGVSVRDGGQRGDLVSEMDLVSEVMSDVSVTGGIWCQYQRWDLMSEMGSSVRGGIWCQRWDLVSEVGYGVRGGIWCQRGGI